MSEVEVVTDDAVVAEQQLVDEAVAEAVDAEQAVTASGSVAEGLVAVFNRKYGFTSVATPVVASPEVQTSEVPDGQPTDN